MNKVTIGAVIAAVASLFGVGFAVYENHQTDKKIRMSLDDLRNASVKEISEHLLKEAVHGAADIAVDKYMHKDNDDILKKAHQSLDTHVDRVVSGRFDAITKEVGDRIASKISQMDDAVQIRNDIRNKACDMLANRFSDDLDDMRKYAKDRLDDAVDDFNNKLDDKLEGYSDKLVGISKAFDSIEKAFNRSNDSGKEIRVTLG